ncbi:isoprenyl transferase, partial [Bacillus haynesii]|nr:isoprenyl transferase [Bacillus haynesii]
DLLKTFETEDKIADKEIKCYKEKLKAAGIPQYMYVMIQLAIQKFKRGIAELELKQEEKKKLASFLLNKFDKED